MPGPGPSIRPVHPPCVKGPASHADPTRMRAAARGAGHCTEPGRRRPQRGMPGDGQQSVIACCKSTHCEARTRCRVGCDEPMALRPELRPDARLSASMVWRFEHSMQHELAECLALERVLRQAMQARPCNSAQSPTSCRASGRPTACWPAPTAALAPLRAWTSARGTAHSVGEAEEGLLGLSIGHWVIEQTCALQARWVAEGRAGFAASASATSALGIRPSWT